MNVLVLGVLLLIVFYVLLKQRREHFGRGICDSFIGNPTICYFADICNFIPKMSFTQWIRDFACGQGGCPEDKENFNGLCYTRCKDGFKSAGIAPYMCYKQYPEFEHNGMLHSMLNLTKASKTVVGSGVNTCKGDKSEKDAGLCYTACKKGMKGAGPMCWNDVYGVGIGTVP
jgi:hypothetical protein